MDWMGDTEVETEVIKLFLTKKMLSVDDSACAWKTAGGESRQGRRLFPSWDYTGCCQRRSTWRSGGASGAAQPWRIYPSKRPPNVPARQVCLTTWRTTAVNNCMLVSGTALQSRDCQGFRPWCESCIFAESQILATLKNLSAFHFLINQHCVVTPLCWLQSCSCSPHLLAHMSELFAIAYQVEWDGNFLSFRWLLKQIQVIFIFSDLAITCNYIRFFFGHKYVSMLCKRKNLVEV